MTENLISALLNEIIRTVIIIERYKAIGPPGIFGATLMQDEVDAAKQAIAEGDTAAMLRCLAALRDNRE